jgi:hypothetical protein
MRRTHCCPQSKDFNSSFYNDGDYNDYLGEEAEHNLDI